MLENKKKKKSEPFDADLFRDFCIELDIWERTPSGGIAVKPGPLRYTTKEVERKFKERMKDLERKEKKKIRR